MAEPHPTLRARVRPFARVGSQMASEVGHPCKLFTTFGTLVWPDSCVYDFVFPQTPFIIKPTAAVVTDAWLLASMSAFVYRQTLKRRAVLSTVPAQIATIHTNRFVDTHLRFSLVLVTAMGSETPDSSKAFIAFGTANLSILTHRG